MSEQEIKLGDLFRRCDTGGTGFIGRDEFRRLCCDFELDVNDADIIFGDLDHDADGKISFEDFCFGFRDAMTPDSRRGSMQLGLQQQQQFKELDCNHDEVERQQRLMEARHEEAKQAWKSFADHLGKEEVRKFLSVRYALIRLG